MKKMLSIMMAGLLAAGLGAMPVHAMEPGSTRLAKRSVQRALSEEEEKAKSKGSLIYTESYEDLFNRLKKIRDYYYYPIYEDYLEYEEAASYDGVSAKESYDTSSVNASAEAAYEMGSSLESGSSSDDFSNTNLRDASVDEADIVKTDGRYIYIIRNRSDLVIAEADGLDLTLISRTKIGEESNDFYRSVMDFYLDGSRIYVISSDYGRQKNDSGYYGNYVYYTTVYTYDVSDPVNPVLLGAAYQEGDYIESRKKDGCIYLFSSWYPSINDTMEDSTFIPDVNGAKVPAEAFCIPQSASSREYLIVGSVKGENPDTFSDVDVFVSGSELFYVSANSIFVLNQDYDSRAKTEITRFSYQDGTVEGVADAYVNGLVNDSFSLDEYQGYLRVLTTYFGYYRDGILSDIMMELTDEYWTRRNALTVLDENLNEVGFISGIAKNEEVRSARFMGDIAYFVTFENTDPLFTVDLSDPASPKILGELEVTGFSSYLHPYGEGRMLGFGYDADEYGRTQGLKLSLFDVTDQADVKELSRSVIPGIRSCPAMSDYKLILADGKKNVIGFYCDNRFFIYKVEDDQIIRQKICDLVEKDLYADNYNNQTKGLYISDTLYICGDGFILPVSLITLEIAEPLKF